MLRLRPHQARLLLGIAVAASILLAGLVLYQLGASLMKKLPLLGALAACALLSGCALPGVGGVGGGVDQATLKTILDHAETCSRHYHGSTGIPPSLSIQIDCEARPAAAASTLPVSSGTP